MKPKVNLEPWVDECTGATVLVHKESLCMGEYCCLHNPSDHHMKEWPKHWREDRKMMERICSHGIGHPDPDDLAYAGDSADGVHGCDGCCVEGG